RSPSTRIVARGTITVRGRGGVVRAVGGGAWAAAGAATGTAAAGPSCAAALVAAARATTQDDASQIVDFAIFARRGDEEWRDPKGFQGRVALEIPPRGPGPGGGFRRGQKPAGTASPITPGGGARGGGRDGGDGPRPTHRPPLPASRGGVRR